MAQRGQRAKERDEHAAELCSVGSALSPCLSTHHPCAGHPALGQPRTRYSLLHTYATTELLSGTDIHTPAQQMGRLEHMLERHYSKLTATMAAGQLA